MAVLTAQSPVLKLIPQLIREGGYLWKVPGHNVATARFSGAPFFNKVLRIYPILSKARTFAPLFRVKGALVRARARAREHWVRVFIKKRCFSYFEHSVTEYFELKSPFYIS